MLTCLNRLCCEYILWSKLHSPSVCNRTSSRESHEYHCITAQLLPPFPTWAHQMGGPLEVIKLFTFLGVWITPGIHLVVTFYYIVCLSLLSKSNLLLSIVAMSRFIFKVVYLFCLASEVVPAVSANFPTILVIICGPRY